MTKGEILMLVQDFLNNWLSTYGKHNLRDTTYKEYLRHITQYINPRIGNVEIQELTPLELQDFLYDVLENGRQRGDNQQLNPKTVIQTQRILHKAFSNAVKLQIIKTNPADFVDIPKKKKFKYNILLGDELREFIKAFEGLHIYNAVVLALLLGLRRGELLALTFEDINFEDKSIYINKSVVNGRDRQVKLDTTKTDEERIIILSDDMIKFLEEIYKENNYNMKSCVVPNMYGKMYNPASFSRLYTYSRDSRKLPKVRFHDLRHIHATILYKNGVQAKVIQERLGHSNISTTLDIYTHLFKEDQRQAASIISRNILK